MQPQMIVFGLVNALHDLFTVIWIGGLIITALVVMPAYKKTLKPKDKENTFLTVYQKNLSTIVIVSIIGLWVTGVLLARRSGQVSGLLNFSNPYATFISIKHIITLIMIAIAFIRRFGPGRKLAAMTPEKMKLYISLLMVNLVLGIGVLVLSGLAAAMP